MNRYLQHHIDKKENVRHLDDMNFQNMDYTIGLEQANDSHKIILDQDHENNLNNKKQYQSIQAQRMFIIKDQDQNKSENNQNQKSKRKSQKKQSQIKISYSNSKEKLKLNNFFGSKKQIQRLPEPQPNSINEVNPQHIQNSSTQLHNTNSKLAKLVQKQIQLKKQWQQRRNQQNAALQQDKISDNSSFHKSSSTNLLKKINQEKFLSKNMQKNIIFEQNKPSQIEYINIEKTVQKNQQQNQKREKRKKNLPQLNPLKTRPSTLSILNQLQFLKKNSKKQQVSSVKEQQPKTDDKTKALENLAESLRKFNVQPIMKNKFLIGHLQRNKQGLCNTFFPIYNFHLQDKTYIISAQKTMTGYIICSDQSELSQSSPGFLGQLRGNLLGSVYNLYKANSKDEILATYIYNSQFSTQSLVRDTQIYIKSRKIPYMQLQRDNPNDKSSNLQQLYSQRQNMVQKKIIKYINKKPIYDQTTKRFILNLGLKNVIPSVKNAIIINPDIPQDSLIVFAKTGDNSFYLKASNPFSMLTVIGYLMSSFNFKFLIQ